MNRDIFFRGKRVTGSGFIYGNLVVDKVSGRYYIHSDHVYLNNIEVSYANVYEVIPKTVGQFTGLYDRNGAKIFEGDVDQHKGFVIWNLDDASFCSEYIGGETIPMEHTSEWMDVIGNIHDNPELIRKP